MTLSLIVKLLFNLDIEGMENVPDNPADIVITPSHTSYWDPPLLGVAFGLSREIHFIAREGLLKNPLFSLPVRTFSTTINRENFGKKDLIKMMRAFQGEGLICVFPEGTTTGNVKPKSGTVRMAEKSNRKFLPIKIEYERSPIEFPFLFAPARMAIGKPVSLEELKRSAAESLGKEASDIESDYRALSFRLMDIINGL